MSREPLEQVRRWLAAEKSGRTDEADQEFRQVFRLVPRAEPSASFGGRVLAAVSSAGPQASLRRAGWFVLRPVVAASLLLSGLAVLSVSGSPPVPPVGTIVGTGVAAFTAVTACTNRAAEAGLAVWRLFGDIGLAARAVASTPPVSVAIGLNAALALLSFLGLRRVLTPLEEPR